MGLSDLLSTKWVNDGNCFNLIAEKFNTVCLLLLMCWKDIHGIATNPKGATVKVHIVSF